MRQAFLMIFLLLVIPLQAKTATAPKIIKLQPSPGNTNYYEPRIVVKLSAVPKQSFNIELQPAMKVGLISKGIEMIWECKPNTIFRPKTNYIATLTSSQPFLYKGKQTKKISWAFKTADEQSLYEQWENYGLEESVAQNDPLRLYISGSRSDHFNIDPPEKHGGAYAVTLYAIFNAGVNGPPIAEQEREYKRQLKSYKKEALNWIKLRCKKYGLNPKNIRVRWVPKEAAKI